MRIAIVCPYSWTYPGGVSEHITGLAESLIERGHDVTVFAPWDPPDRRSRVLHRAAVPQTVPQPTYLVPLGRTIGVRANGAVSNLSLSPRGVVRLVRALRRGGFDVVHIHEPDAPALGWAAAYGATSARVGTLHTYNEHRFAHGVATLLGVRRVLNRLHVRIAVSEAAAWTGKRFFGGRYRIVPNGVRIDRAPADVVPSGDVLAGAGRPNESESPEPLGIVFVGQPVERKGLPTLLRAFEALRERIPCELTLVGPTTDDIGPLMLDPRDVRALGKVDDEHKRAELRAADVLCAPSTGGESFGMVLTEAFAAGIPVVASDIPGYRDIVRPGVDGLLVPPRDPQLLAEALLELAEHPDRRKAMGEAATEAAPAYAWERVSRDVLEAYRDAMATPAPTGTRQRIAVRLGLTPADLQPRVPACRLPTLQAPAAHLRGRAGPLRRALSVAALIIVAVLCWLAIRKIGLHSVTAALKHTSVPWVVLGIAVMSAAMVLRAVSWHAALRAALPRAHIRLFDAARGLFLGVLVSSTLPANLGEPSRVLVVARRTERPWESVPIVAGTILSQSLLNVIFVLILGLVTLASVNLGTGTREGLAVGAAGAAVAVVVVLAAPQLIHRSRPDSRLRRIWIIAGRVRAGLIVFRRPRLALSMIGGQVGAWTLQWLGVYLILVGTRLGGRAGPLGAIAVLCAVNVTLVLPATPGDVGVFQAAASAVLHAGWHIPYAEGIAYGVVLQAAELVTALVMGLPALLREGLSWRHMGSVTTAAVTVTLPALKDRVPPRYRLADDDPPDETTDPAASGG
jgi:phosphatidylinositol alpha-mannosyltransferase